MSENVINVLSWYENGVAGTKMSILAQLFWILGWFSPFWSHFGTPGAKIWGNQLLEMSENVINELCCYENVVVGTKMSILAQLVWIIGWFSPFWTIFGAILAPLGPKLGYQIIGGDWKCCEWTPLVWKWGDRNKSGILAQLVWIIGWFFPFRTIFGTNFDPWGPNLAKSFFF